ncbi:C39 family peptidase [Saccharothrix coeruleofusca]|uniref:C39 family peptidase n=1 Tax=Saccharothrix coeruleofusca TaxID=33919 RepID=UPI00166F6515|nr:C39 family peptidase [Saccharothrix coeruleofusca]
MRSRVLCSVLLGVTTVLSVVTPAAAEGSEVDYREWRAGDFRRGHFEGTAPWLGGLVLARPAGRVEHEAKTYDYARWTSPVHRVGFAATQAVASWNARTPAGTWLQVEFRGADTGWYVMGRWASGDGDIKRATVSGQSDEHGYVDVDTYVARRPLRGYQLRVTLYRQVGSHATPSVSMVGAMASAVPDRFTVPASSPGPARGVELPVPRYSQNVHAGQYPEYDNGGEAWCSPTSTEMVVEYWRRGPTPQDLAWVKPGYPDPSVAHAARHTYDYDYQGAGNWPFNTAYAATFGLRAHVTRLRSLTELERYIARGIPVITSQSFREDELDGAGYGTAGHIMVVVGFTESGDVIANDPASPSNEAVRRVYKRAQFETVWLRTQRHLADGTVGGGSGGIAYIIAPPGR